MIRAPRIPASSTICATSRRGIRSVTITISSIPASRASNTASLVNAGGTVTTEPLGTYPTASTTCCDGVEDGHAVDLAPLAPRGHAADHLGPVVEALPGQVDGLAAGDALHDEGEALVEQDAHRPRPDSWIFATARPAASHIETLRSQYSTP